MDKCWKVTSSVVLLVIIFNQIQFQNLGLQDEQNNELKTWINLKSKSTWLAASSNL